MPFERKRRNKTAGDYAQKSVYLNLDDVFQKEAFDLFTLCGHKQSRFLGLLVHDFIMRYQVDPGSMSKKEFSDCIRFYEMQITNKMTFNSGMIAGGVIPASEQIPVREPVVRQPPSKRASPIAQGKNSTVQARKQGPNVLIHEDVGDDGGDFISEDDMDEMNKALAAFGT